MPTDILILDDDRLARMDLVSFVRDLPGAGTIHEAGSLAAACALTAKTRVYFLDIDLGRGTTGFDFVRHIPERKKAAIIFITAHNNYAHHAFDCEATDYLVKPVDAKRLAVAWERAMQRLNAKAPAVFFPLETPTGVERLDVMELLFIESEGGNYVRLHLRDGRHPVLRCSFAKWGAGFPGGVLVECSRGVAANARHIQALTLDKGGETVLKLSDGRTLNVARRRQSELRGLLLRIGIQV